MSWASRSLASSPRQGCPRLAGWGLERQGFPSTEAPLLSSGGCPAADRAEAGGKGASPCRAALGCGEGADTGRSQALELNKRKVRQMTWARAWLCCPTQPRSLSDNSNVPDPVLRTFPAGSCFALK